MTSESIIKIILGCVKAIDEKSPDHSYRVFISRGGRHHNYNWVLPDFYKPGTPLSFGIYIECRTDDEWMSIFKQEHTVVDAEMYDKVIQNITAELFMYGILNCAGVTKEFKQSSMLES